MQCIPKTVNSDFLARQQIPLKMSYPSPIVLKGSTKNK